MDMHWSIWESTGTIIMMSGPIVCKVREGGGGKDTHRALKMISRFFTLSWVSFCTASLLSKRRIQGMLGVS